jgi:hypothetical protein
LRFDSGEEGILGFHQISSIEPLSREQEVVSQGEKGTVLVDNVRLVDSLQSAAFPSL